MACHTYKQRHCFSANVQIPDITFCIHQILYVGIKSYEYAMYSVLPLSCFVGIGQWWPSHPIVGGKVGEWHVPSKLQW